MAEQFKKQHIVPQSYLKRFAEQRGKNKYIIGTRFAKNDSKKPLLFKDNIDSVGYIDNYYDYDYLDDKKFWEHFFSRNIDSMCGRRLGNMIAKITLSPSDDNILSKKDRIVLSEIIYAQAVKVPAFIEENKKKLKTIIGNEKQKLLQENPQYSQKEINIINSINFNDADIKEIILENMFKETFYEECIRILLNRTWLIFYNTRADIMPFVTSDNPVLCINAKTKETGILHNGIGSNSVIIYYPVSPHILIGLFPSSFFWGKETEFDSKRYYIDEIKFLSKLNEDIIKQSYQHSFLPKELFEFILASDK